MTSCFERNFKYVLFLAVVIANGRQAGKLFLSNEHRLSEHHDQTTDNREVTEEEVKVEDEAVSETLDDDYAEETANCKFGVAFCYDCTGTGKHGLWRWVSG